MKKTLFNLLLLSTIVIQPVIAQDTIPVLKGTVNISITKGTFDCDITLDNIPRIKDYVIRLNSGMNILYFKSLDKDFLIAYDKALNDTLSTYESTAYYFPDNTGKGKFLPHSLKMIYTGKYPVAKDSIKNYSRQDWKGNIAFNGYSVRTDGMQSCWYPVLYDVAKDVILNKVKYDLTINCADCNVIYLNGSNPVTGTKATFKSDIPYDLSMYSGRYKIAKVDSTYFLNPDMNAAQTKQFGNLTNNFKKFYEDKLGINYKTNITYVQTTPASKYNAWLFVSYPTIFNIGYGKYGLKGLFDEPGGDHYKAFIAHELGHYYFGTYKVFNAELGDMMTEGFAEYLSLEATRQLVADSIYQQILNKKIKELKDFKAMPFAAVKSKADYDNRELYVYYYAPMVFSAIKKEIGDQAMWLWLKTILTTEADRTNYDFLLNTLSATLQNRDKLEMVKTKYFESASSLDNAIHTIEQK
jgi:hypothetical protein